MSLYSNIHRRMWNDENFRSLSRPQPNGQTLWTRLLCGPELTCIPGLFPAREGGLADALGWDLKAFREVWREVSERGMARADWSAGLVWVPKALKNNPPQSPNVVIAWAKAFAELPECPLKNEAFAHIKSLCEGIGKGFREVWPKAFGRYGAIPLETKIKIKTQEQDQDQEDLYSDLNALPDGALPGRAATPVPGLLVTVPVGDELCSPAETARRWALASDVTPEATPDQNATKPAKRARKPKAPKPEPEGHALVVRTYFEAFEAARKTKPVFGGKEGKAVSRLLDATGSPERACEAIRNAYADQWHARNATIMTIANDPAKHLGELKPLSQSGSWSRRIVQSDDTFADKNDPGGWNAAEQWTRKDAING